MSTPAAPCAGCGRTRPEGFVCCKPCWDALPFSLRQEFSKASLSKRSGMLPGILERLKALAAPVAAVVGLLVLCLTSTASATPEQEGELRAALSAAIQAGEEARAAGEEIQRENTKLQAANAELRTSNTQATLALGRAEAEATRLKIDADLNQKAAEENAEKLRAAKREIEELSESRAWWRNGAIGLGLLAGLYVFLRLHPATRLIVP